jgi:predicted DNA-binding transcriptional regulator AlpA
MRADLAESLGFHGKKRVHSGLATPTEGPTMDGRCISQNELAQRWQVSEATLERWRSQRKGPQILRLGGQVRYRLVDVESYECERMEVFGTGQNNLKALISPVQTDKNNSRNQLPTI